MDLSDDLLEEIGAYLGGRLTAEETARFEARLRADAALREEVATQREIKQGLQWLDQKARFRAMHADLENRGLLQQPTAPVVKELPAVRRATVRSWAYVAVAASLVLVLGLGWVAYQNWAENRALSAQNGEAFARFFAPNLKPQSAPTIDPDRLGAPLSPPASADSARLAAAVALLQRRETATAISELKPVADGSPGHWSASAQWFLALAFLKNDEREPAEALLARIAGLNGHPYQAEAQRLRQRLAETP
mgnify:CR=1 FL=1